MSHPTQNVRHKLVLAMVPWPSQASRGACVVRGGQKPEISRVIAKEYDRGTEGAAGRQWQEALKNLDAASDKSAHAVSTRRTIFDFQGVADVRLSKLKTPGEL